MSTIVTTPTVRVIEGTWNADPSHSTVEFAVKHMGFSTVRGRFLDFDATVEDAVRHLREHGHHELVLISGDLDDPRFHDYGPWVRTEEAYRRVVASYDLPIRIIPCSDTTQAGKAAAARVLTEYPETTAILVLNEYAALGVVAGLKHTGHDIPGDISVLSLLTVPETAAMADPELTMMRTPGPTNTGP